MLLVPSSLAVNAVKVRQGNLKVNVLQVLWFFCSFNVADGSKYLDIWFSLAVSQSDPTSDFALNTSCFSDSVQCKDLLRVKSRSSLYQALEIHSETCRCGGKWETALTTMFCSVE